MWPQLPTLQRARTLPIGLHVSHESVTAAQFVVQGGRLAVHSLAQTALPRDESASVDEQDREAAAAVRRMIAGHRFRGHDVVSCLGFEHLFIQNLRLPQLTPAEADRQIRMEIEERLPYAFTDAEIRHLVAGDIRQDGDLKQEVILFGCHRGVIRRHLNLLEEAGLQPLAVDIEALALLRALSAAGSPPARRGILLLGDRSTAVIVADGQHLLFLKYLATGASHLDQAVARHLVLSAADAARTRSTVTNSPSVDAGNDVHCAVIDAIRAPMDAFRVELELCLRYFKVTFRGQPVESLIVAGPNATGWMADYLQSRLGLSCTVADPFGQCGLPEPARERGARWTVACGLSLKRWGPTARP